MHLNMMEQHPDQQTLILFHLQQRFLNLPSVIRDEMAREQGLLAELGFQTGTFIALDAFEFEEDKFRWGVYQAVKNGDHVVIDTGGDEVTLSSTLENDRYQISFCGPEMNEPAALRIDIPEVLLDDPENWHEPLKRNRLMLDSSNAELELLVEELKQLSAIGRMKRIEGLLNSSAYRYYVDLAKKINRDKEFRVEDLFPPNAESILKLLRVSTESDLDTFSGLSQSANNLLEITGFIEAFRRLSGLPNSLSSDMSQNIKKLGIQEQKEIVRSLLKQVGSPISKLNLVRLLRELSVGYPAFGRLGNRIGLSLISKFGLAEMDLWLSVLNWTSRVSHRIEGYDELKNSDQLIVIWVHTNELFKILIRSFPTEDLSRFFDKADQSTRTMNMLIQDMDIWLDISHPMRVNQMRFLVNGFAYAFTSNVTPNPPSLVVDYLITESFATDPERDQVFLNPSLWVARNQATNMLNSFLGHEIDSNAHIVLGEDLAKSMSTEAVKSFVGAIIEEIKIHPENLLIWNFLANIFNGLPVYDDLADDLIDRYIEFDFTEALSSNSIIVLSPLQAIAMQIGYLDNEQVYKKMLSDILIVGHHYNREKLLTRDEIQEASSMLVNILLFGVLLNSELDNRVDELTTNLEMLSQRWSATHPHISNTCTFLLQQQMQADKSSILALLTRTRST